MIEAYIFDMDGTLIDSEVLWVDAVAELLRNEGVALTPEEALALVYGKSWNDIHAEATARYPGLDMDLARMTAAVGPIFQRLRACRDIRIPGSIALLRRLARDHPVCIVSGSSARDVEEGIALMGVGDLLAFHLAAEHYPHGKPDPTCFLMAAERLGVDPGRCVVFEDSTVGIRAAKGAGMRCVAIARPDRPRQDVSQADLALDDLGRFDPAMLGGSPGA